MNYRHSPVLLKNLSQHNIKKIACGTDSSYALTGNVFKN
jgi:hypothetical protein